jgi:hypothetical protein
VHSKAILDDLTSSYLPTKQRRIPQVDLSREKAREDEAKLNYRNELDNLLQAALGLRSSNQTIERDNDILIELEEGEEATDFVIDQQ